MFLAFWLAWALVGLSAAVLLFTWAVRTRQFESGRRAALIPFDDIAPEERPQPRSLGRGQMLLIVFAAVLVTALTALMLVTAITSL